jgi:hypothetical protein
MLKRARVPNPRAFPFPFPRVSHGVKTRAHSTRAGFLFSSFRWIEPARAREFLRVARAFRFPRAFPFFQSAQIVNDRVPRFPIPNRVSNTLQRECHTVKFYQESNGLYHSRFPWIAYNATDCRLLAFRCIPFVSVYFIPFRSVSVFNGFPVSGIIPLWYVLNGFHMRQIRL